MSALTISTETLVTVERESTPGWSEGQNYEAALEAATLIHPHANLILEDERGTIQKTYVWSVQA